jgi:HlyD family secretion protein
MSGKVERVYATYNDTVRAGDVLAVLNTDMLSLRREQEEAGVFKARTAYELQLINYRSQQALALKNLISEYELQSSLTALESLGADLRVADMKNDALKYE